MDPGKEHLFESMRRFLTVQMRETALPDDLAMLHKNLCLQLNKFEDPPVDEQLVGNPMSSFDNDSLLQGSPGPNQFFATDDQDLFIPTTSSAMMDSVDAVPLRPNNRTDKRKEFSDDLSPYENAEDVFHKNEDVNFLPAVSSPTSSRSPLANVLTKLGFNRIQSEIFQPNNESTQQPPSSELCRWSGEVFVRFHSKPDSLSSKLMPYVTIDHRKWHLRVAYLTERTFEIFKAYVPVFQTRADSSRVFSMSGIGSCREKSATGALMERAQKFELSIPLDFVTQVTMALNIAGKSRVVAIRCQDGKLLYITPRSGLEFEVWLMKFTEAMETTPKSLQICQSNESEIQDTPSQSNVRCSSFQYSESISNGSTSSATAQRSSIVSTVLDWKQHMFATISRHRMISAIRSPSPTASASNYPFHSYPRSKHAATSNGINHVVESAQLWQPNTPQISRRLPRYGGHKGTLVPVNPNDVSMQGKLLVYSPTLKLKPDNGLAAASSRSSRNGPLSHRMPLSTWSWNIHSRLQRSTPRFQRRYCLLSRGFFSIFNSAKSDSASVQVQFPLFGCSITYDKEDIIGDRFRFVLVQGLRILLVLEAPNQIDYANWVNALIKAIPRSVSPPRSLSDDDYLNGVPSADTSPIYEKANRLIPHSINTLEALAPGRNSFTMDCRDEFCVTQTGCVSRSLSTSVLNDRQKLQHLKYRWRSNEVFRTSSIREENDLCSSSSPSLRDKSCPTLSQLSSRSDKNLRKATLARITSDPLYWYQMEEEDFPELPSRSKCAHHADADRNRLFYRKSSVISLTSWFNRSVISSPALHRRKRDDCAASTSGNAPLSVSRTTSAISEKESQSGSTGVKAAQPRPQSKLLQSFRRFGDRLKDSWSRRKKGALSPRNDETEEETYASCVEVNNAPSASTTIKSNIGSLPEEDESPPPCLPPRVLQYGAD